MSAVMWLRGFLQDEFGIAAKDMNWVQGGLENPGRRDKFPLNLPEGFPLVSASDGRCRRCWRMASSTRSCRRAGRPASSRTSQGAAAVSRLSRGRARLLRRSGLFPIMHAVGIRRDVLEKHPWLAASVYKAFVQAKRIADAEFAETTALKIGLPWVTAELDATREVMGEDFWSYGTAANRKTLATMARYSYEQGLAVRLLTVEEMFAEGNLGETRVYGGGHGGSVDLLFSQPADDDRRRGDRANVTRSSSTSLARPLRRCTRSSPTWSWCSGPTISTASSTS